MLGPGQNWWPINEQEEKVAGPFTTTAEFDAWLDEMECGEVPVVNQVLWEGAMRTLVILLAIVATGIPAQAQNPSPIVGTRRSSASFDRLA
jgi:hypothetical protein